MRPFGSQRAKFYIVGPLFRFSYMIRSSPSRVFRRVWCVFRPLCDLTEPPRDPRHGHQDSQWQNGEYHFSTIYRGAKAPSELPLSPPRSLFFLKKQHMLCCDPLSNPSHPSSLLPLLRLPFTLIYSWYALGCVPLGVGCP